MKNLKASLAAAAVLAVTSLFSAPEAKAWDFCTNAYGQSLCANYGRVDEVAITGNLGTEAFSIQCRNGRAVDWNSYGDYSRSQAQIFVNSFCSTRGTSY